MALSVRIAFPSVVPMVELSLALIDCVKRGDVEAVEALLAVGADPNSTDLMEGVSVLHFATRQGDGRLAELLVQLGALPAEPLAQAPVDFPLPPQPPNGIEKPLESKTDASGPSWAAQLVQLYRMVGYLRRPQRDATGPAAELDRLWELRFLVSDKRSLRTMQDVLHKAGFSFGDPVKLGGRLTQRVPGREAVERITSLLAASPLG